MPYIIIIYHWSVHTCIEHSTLALCNLPSGVCIIDGVTYSEGQEIPDDDPCQFWWVFMLSLDLRAYLSGERPGYLYFPSRLNPSWYIQAQFPWKSCVTRNVYHYFIFEYYHWNCMIRITERARSYSPMSIFPWPVLPPFYWLVSAGVFPCSSDIKFDTSSFPAWRIMTSCLSNSLT